LLFKIGVQKEIQIGIQLACSSFISNCFNWNLKIASSPVTRAIFINNIKDLKLQLLFRSVP